MKKVLILLFSLVEIFLVTPLNDIILSSPENISVSNIEDVSSKNIHYECNCDFEHTENNEEKNIVITYGTFDLLHYGHINILKRAKELGDYLVVALSTDDFNWNQKHKKCYFSYEQRKLLLESIKYVDLVIPEDSWEQKHHDIYKYNVSKFVMGDDWAGKFDYLKEDGVEVIYLPRTPNISTTQIKQELSLVC